MICTHQVSVINILFYAPVLTKEYLNYQSGYILDWEQLQNADWLQNFEHKAPIKA